MELYDLVMPLGIITYVLIAFAVLTGKRVIKLHPRWHRIAAGFALAFATMHAGIVIYLKI
ncbi:MAG: hypothetical protein PHF33_03765 [Candidatus Delongbacteria bacterium]|nr:hypothetical protein [Candidatus Delongbacteria bacterium]MDD4205433.1 hypothetical protein [Candidatus Delongbacteria bacterium]